VRQLPDLQVQEDEGPGEPVVEHQVDEEMLAVERDPLLSAHEGEALAQFEEELLELGDQGPFQVGLAEPLVLAEPGEFEDQGVLHQVGRPRDLVPLDGQCHDARLVPAQGQPLEEQRVDLSLQLAGRPPRVDGLGLVEGPRVGTVDAEQEAIMGPGQFVTQCVTNRVDQEECTHVAKVGLVEALAELRLQASSEPFQDPLAVTGPLLPRLLVLDDDPADFPVGLDHGRVDRLPGPIPGGGEDLADLPVEGVEMMLGRLPSRFLGRGRGRLGRWIAVLRSFFRHAIGYSKA
jgi:hypothetical protein